MTVSLRISALIACLGILLPISAGAVVYGQIDTFEDGTTQGWIAGLLGAPHPAPPVNIPTGGPDGLDDNYMLLTAIGGGGAGSKLSAINRAQWAGDYIGAGITSIGMNLINMGQTDLFIRLLISDPLVGAPENTAISTVPIILPAGGAWTAVDFLIAPGDLTAILGSSTTALTNAAEIRIFHSIALGFPGESVATQLGVDNIHAGLVAPVPEPSTVMLLGAGLAALTAGKLGLRRRV